MIHLQGTNPLWSTIHHHLKGPGYLLSTPSLILHTLSNLPPNHRPNLGLATLCVGWHAWMLAPPFSLTLATTTHVCMHGSSHRVWKRESERRGRPGPGEHMQPTGMPPPMPGQVLWHLQALHPPPVPLLPFLASLPSFLNRGHRRGDNPVLFFPCCAY
jgi:hypothetical protein